MSERWLIVGLGNPGRRYAQTRHNIGWFVLDELAQRHGLNFSRNAQGACLAEGRIVGRVVLLARPQGYMNRSGQPVRGLMRYWRIEPQRLLVVLDDLDQPPGMLRLRAEGGAGGQRGLQDIIAQLGTREFSRMRLGIGRPPGRMEPSAWVLRPFRGDEAIQAREMVGRAADAAETWLRDSIEAAMTRYNGDGTKPATAAPQETPEEALQRWLRAQELNVSDPGPPEQISRALLRLGREQEAADWLLRAAALHQERGQLARALAQQERALKLNPGHVDAQRELAAQWLAQGNARKAAQRLWLLAEWLAQQGRNAEALAELDELLALNEQHSNALALRQRIVAKSGTEELPQTSER